jgi:hypothetical protein
MFVLVLCEKEKGLAFLLQLKHSVHVTSVCWHYSSLSPKRVVLQPFNKLAAFGRRSLQVFVQFRFAVLRDWIFLKLLLNPLLNKR